MVAASREQKEQESMATLIKQSRTVSDARPRYRVWHAFNVPHNMDYYAVESPAEALELLDKLIKHDLDDDNEVESNAFGLEEWDEDDGYSEWNNEDGEDIMAVLDARDDTAVPS